MSELCNLRINLNSQHTFFLNEDVLSEYSGKLRKMIKQGKRRKKPNREAQTLIEIEDFPGGYNGFELVSRFCYSNGKIAITASNVSILHCCSIYLEMTEKISTSNLFYQTEKFLEGIFEWSWTDVLSCLKNCESVFCYAVSYGLLQKLICALLAQIAQNSDANTVFSSPSSSSSSNETNRWLRFSFSSKNNNNTSESANKPCSSSGSFSCKPSNREWWFEDLTILSPKIIERLIKSLGIYGADNNSLTITRFLLQYLKTRNQIESNKLELAENKSEYGGLADTAIQGVIFSGKTEFSCRKLFWILRVLSNFSLSKESRTSHERLIGEILDQATLDDLLISGRHRGVYDVDFVIRLLTVFVNSAESNCLEKLKKIGRLIDVYLGEISPDQSLKVSKFLGVAEILPDSARDCFDGVYTAIDIYLEAHPSLSFEERSNLCRCLNYDKLTFETCKELARNPKIPPNIAIEALKSQNSRMPNTNYEDYDVVYDEMRNTNSNSIGNVHHRHLDRKPLKSSFRKHEQFDSRHPNKKPTILSPRKHEQFDSRHHDWTPMGLSPRKYEQFDPRHPDRKPTILSSPCKYEQFDSRYPDRMSMSPCKHSQFDVEEEEDEDEDGSEEIRYNLEKMQWRVVELEKVCKEMKGQMSRLAKHRVSNSNYSINSPSPNRTLPKLC